jgi:excisionase family DNA binding protein
MKIDLLTTDDLIEFLRNMESPQKKVDSISGGLGHKSIYTLAETCSLLQISRRTLQKYRDQGMISYTQIGNKIYFRAEDINEFLDRYRINSINNTQN